MPEQSHLDEMNAAIRAQRERQAVPRSMVSTEDARPEPKPEPEPVQAPAQAEPAPVPEQQPKPAARPRRGFLARLRGV